MSQLGGSGAGGSSFSDWFQEAEKVSKAGGDPIKAGSHGGASSATGSPVDYLPSWVKSWTTADAKVDDLEAGGLLSRPSADLNASSGGDEYALSRTERFRWFMTLLALGVFFFVLSFFFLGLVLVFPGKFAFSFSLGSVSFMSAFIVMQGFKQWASEVFKRERLPFALTYFGSIIGTLVSTLYLRSYIAIVVFSAVQISALGWYFATYVPGGQHGMRMISAFVKGSCRTCVKGCRLCVGI